MIIPEVCQECEYYKTLTPKECAEFSKGCKLKEAERRKDEV